MKNNNDKIDMTEQGRLLDLSEHKKKPFSQRTDLKLNKDYVVNTVSSFNTIGFFKIAFFILLIVSMARIIKNPTSPSLPSLQSLLDLLSNAPNISGDIQFIFSKLTIPDFPFPFNWVSWILNTFIDAWSVVIWFGTAVWNVFIFIGYFAIWILGV